MNKDRAQARLKFSGSEQTHKNWGLGRGIYPRYDVINIRNRRRRSGDKSRSRNSATVALPLNGKRQCDRSTGFTLTPASHAMALSL